jgi:hypothetical protein
VPRPDGLAPAAFASVHGTQDRFCWTEPRTPAFWGFDLLPPSRVHFTANPTPRPSIFGRFSTTVCNLCGTLRRPAAQLFSGYCRSRCIGSAAAPKRYRCSGGPAPASLRTVLRCPSQRIARFDLAVNQLRARRTSHSSAPARTRKRGYAGELQALLARRPRGPGAAPPQDRAQGGTGAFNKTGHRDTATNGSAPSAPRTDTRPTHRRVFSYDADRLTLQLG